MVDKDYVGIDKDYPDVPVVIPFQARRNHSLTAEEQAHNRVVARCRIVVEQMIAPRNRFTVLRQVFQGRHPGLETAHSQVVRVVARLVNRRLRVCPLKTYAPTA